MFFNAQKSSSPTACKDEADGTKSCVTYSCGSTFFANLNNLLQARVTRRINVDILNSQDELLSSNSATFDQEDYIPDANGNYNWVDTTIQAK